MQHTHRYKLSLILFTLFTFLLASAEPTLAKEKKKKKKKKGNQSSTAPGTYTDWKDEIDKLKIHETFQYSSYSKVVVSGLDTSKTSLPEKDDNTYEPVKEVLKDPVSPFLEGLAKEGVKASKGAASSGTLVVSGVVEEMDPGSKAARYWAGFGAGAARTKLVITVKDGGSGKVLLTMTQERRSGVGVAGGNYVKLMQRNLRAIGKDLAMVLTAF